MVDLRGQYEKIKDEVDAGIRTVIDSCCFVRGSQVQTFENALAAYLGVKHVVAVGNGTDALMIALMALGVQRGDEVIVPAFTFVATAEVAAILGLKPVFVDVDYDTMNISVEAVEKAVTSKTRAIVPVHLFGQNANMDELMKIARKYGLLVVEDACQSIGSAVKVGGVWHKSGTVGDVGCTSFFPSKNLGCYGDGGALFTDDDGLAARIRMIANHGTQIRYHHDIVGVNSRLDSIQAVVLLAKLPWLDSYVEARQRAADYYDSAFEMIANVLIPKRAGWTTHSFHQYTLRCAGTDRDALKEHLAGAGIPSMIYYPVPLHLQRAYAGGYKAGDFPVAERLSCEVLSLPMHTELDEVQLEYIAHTVSGVVKK